MAYLKPGFSFLQRYGATIWLSLLIPLLIWFGIRQRHDLARTWDLTLRANPGWLLSVFFLEIVGFVLVAVVYRILLRHLGHVVKLSVMVKLHLQRVVIGAVAPMGGPSSVVVFVHRLRQRGIQPSDSLLAASIKSVGGHVAFLMILLPAMFLREPTPLMLASAALLAVVVTCMLAAIVLITRRSHPPRWLMRMVPRKGLRVIVQLRQHELSTRCFVLPFTYLAITKASGVLCLFFCLRAVGYHGGFDVAVTAYVISVIFTVMAPIFQGVGLVEIGLAVALQKLGVPGSMAIGATLLSRILGLWIPLTIGLLVQVIEAAQTRIRIPWRTSLV